MNHLLKILLNNLQESLTSDLTCLIKFDQYTFSLVESISAEHLGFNFDSILDMMDSLDFDDIQIKIKSEYSISSYLSNSFHHGNLQYYVFSASRKADHFDEISKTIHFELTKATKEILRFADDGSQKLLANPKNFHLFAEASNELIFILDHSGVFNYINNYGKEKLKYSADEILGKHIYEFISDDSRISIGKAFQTIILEKTKIDFNVEILPKVGIEQLFDVQLIPVLNRGVLESVLGIGINRSELNAEKNRNADLIAKLKEANRINSIERDRAKQQISILNELNTLKNEFISNISHELRTPLASIIGFSETILDDTNLTIDRAKEFSDVILTESKRLAKLINDVLDFSELENERQKLEKNSTNIIDILKDAEQHFKNECDQKKITLTSNIPEAEIIIYADKERLQKAFSYILSNAIKFTHQNGRITLMAQEFLKEVEIIISDTGVGILDQKIPMLFDKFSKVKRAGNNLPGAGFGLVTVKQIIDLHKGLIRVKSELDKGTSFIIRLPKYSFN